MKRIISAALAAMLLIALTACGEGESTKVTVDAKKTTASVAAAADGEKEKATTSAATTTEAKPEKKNEEEVIPTGVLESKDISLSDAAFNADGSSVRGKYEEEMGKYPQISPRLLLWHEELCVDCYEAIATYRFYENGVDGPYEEATYAGRRTGYMNEDGSYIMTTVILDGNEYGYFEDKTGMYNIIYPGPTVFKTQDGQTAYEAPMDLHTSCSYLGYITGEETLFGEALEYDEITTIEEDGEQVLRIYVRKGTEILRGLATKENGVWQYIEIVDYSRDVPEDMKHLPEGVPVSDIAIGDISIDGSLGIDGVFGDIDISGALGIGGDDGAVTAEGDIDIDSILGGLDIEGAVSGAMEDGNFSLDGIASGDLEIDADAIAAQAEGILAGLEGIDTSDFGF